MYAMSQPLLLLILDVEYFQQPNLLGGLLFLSLWAHLKTNGTHNVLDALGIMEHLQ